MGDWYVQVAVPTAFDQSAHNGLEQYTWDEKRKRVKVRYTYNDKSPDGPVKEVLQTGRCNPSDGTAVALSTHLLPNECCSFLATNWPESRTTARSHDL